MTTIPSPSEAPEWSIRAYRPGDERELVALFGRVFGRPITEDHWRWKLKQLLTHAENVWLAVHQDRPIFQYAGIPISVRLSGEEANVMVSVDTMTAPEFQRKGLLSQVGRWTYDNWRQAGVAFVIGLPNERWGSRAAALGWQELFQLQWLVRPLRPEAVLARRTPFKWLPATLSRYSPSGPIWSHLWNRRLPRDESVQIRPVQSASEEFDRLWEDCRADYELSLVRDRAWVEWRYLNPPAFEYRVVLAERRGKPAGYAAYRMEETAGRKTGFVAELFGCRDDEKTRAVLLRYLIGELYAAGAEQALTLAVPGTHLWQTLRRAGFFPRAAFSVQIVPLASGLPMDTLRDPQKWCLAGGDFDVI